MARKLIRHNENLFLEIPAVALGYLGFDEYSELELSIKDDSLIIKQKKYQVKLASDRINETIEKYKSVLEKLSKT